MPPYAFVSSQSRLISTCQLDNGTLGSTHPLLPYDWYHELVMIGARTHGFPEDYLKRIESKQSLRDPDSDRSAEKWKTVEMIRGDI